MGNVLVTDNLAIAVFLGVATLLMLVWVTLQYGDPKILTLFSIPLMIVGLLIGLVGGDPWILPSLVILILGALFGLIAFFFIT